MMWLLLAQLVMWQPHVQPPVLHQGHWQSCDGAERELQHRVNGVLQWSMHLGPDDEFALYRGLVDGEHEHADKQNLLGASYHYRAFKTRAGGRTWTVPALHLLVNVVAGGGSREQCEAFYVLIETTR